MSANKKNLLKYKRFLRIGITLLSIALALLAVMVITLIIDSNRAGEEDRQSTISSNTVITTGAARKGATVGTGAVAVDTTEETTQETTEETTEETTQETTEETAEETTEETTEVITEEETTEEVTTVPQTEAPLTYEDVVFVGDSRTLSLSSGGRLEYMLVPEGSVLATWGGQLPDQSAFDNAATAGAKNSKAAIFWYGVNDVQMNADRDNADAFIANYKAVIDTFIQAGGSGQIYILSILNTTVREKDYYEGQEANITAYNAKIAEYCAQNGYVYLDITALLTGDECFAADDNIHFSKEWYENSFLPYIQDNVMR